MENLPEAVRQHFHASLALFVEFFLPDNELVEDRNGLLNIVVPVGKGLPMHKLLRVWHPWSALDYPNYFIDSSLLDDAVPQEDAIAADAVER